MATLIFSLLIGLFFDRYGWQLLAVFLLAGYFSMAYLKRRADRLNRAKLLNHDLELKDEHALFGGWIFGGWIGLVICGSLFHALIRRRRIDYEPDRGGCVACARCFQYFPNEHVRVAILKGTAMPIDAAPQWIRNQPQAELPPGASASEGTASTDRNQDAT